VSPVQTVEWAFTVYSLPPLLAAVVSVPVAIEAWRNREEPAVKAFLAIVIALFAWSVLYAVQLGFADHRVQAFWRSLSLIVGATLSPLWVVFTFRYAGLENWLTRPVMAVLAAEPTLYAVLILTTGQHGLIWESAAPGSGPGVVLAFTPVYYAHLGYVYALIFVGMGALAWVAADATTVHRKQSAVLVFAVALPFGANVVSKLGLSPLPGVDLTTFGFGIAVTVIALAMFRFDLLDIAPVARRHWSDQLDDGMVVVDRDGAVVESNTVAREVLMPAPEPGYQITTSLPVENLADADGETLERTVGTERRFYDVRYTTLTDHRGEPAGALVTLREVTDRTEYERRLEVANRVLRHNFRNAMNVVHGHARLLTEDLSGEHADHARAIEHRASEVIELNEGIQQMVATLDHRGASMAVDVGSVVESAVEEVRCEFPDVVFTVDAEPARAAVVDRQLLTTAVEHLIENAAGYNDADEPRVSAEVRTVEGHVTIRVTDNGPGIPEEERAVVTDGEETPLVHGSGLGLWLVSWVAEASGGDLRFAENDPRGSVVTFDLPVAADTDTGWGEAPNRSGATVD
jgi:signal transduction histidine kinase